MLDAGTWLAYSGEAVSAVAGSLVEDVGAVVVASARGSVFVDEVGRRCCCCSARMPAQVASWRVEKARTDWRAWRPLGWMVIDGKMAFVRRWRRVGRLGWVVAGWVSRKEERRVEEGVEALRMLRPVARLADDEGVEGRVEVWARASRLEEEAEGNWEVGAVEPRLVEGLCDVVGREDNCGVVEF